MDPTTTPDPFAPRGPHGPPAGVVRRDRAAWLAALADPRHPLAVDDRLLGTLVRRDGWACPPRQINAHWLLLVLEGRCQGQLGGAEVDLRPGALMWVHPGTVHAQQWSRTVRYAELLFGLFDERGQHLTPPGDGLTVLGAAGAHEAIELAADEVQLGGPFHDQRLRALVTSLAVRLWRAEDDTPDADGNPDGVADSGGAKGGGAKGGGAKGRAAIGLTAGQRQRLVRHVRGRPDAPPTVADLARLVDLSPDYFSRQFRVTFGVSPRAWLAGQRMRVAGALLEQTDLAVYQVAARLGYADVAQFSRQFRAYARTSPAAYRRRSGG